MKKAIFLGVRTIHSNKKDQDYRVVDFYTPPFKDASGYMRGGVETIFTPVDSTLGVGINMGAIVVPEFEYNHYSQREELLGMKVVCDSPYSDADFKD